jgi:hypothetical protein
MSALRAFHHSNRLISLQPLATIYCFNHINGLDRGQFSLQAAMKMLIAQLVISNHPIATSSSITKATTTFNDGWTAKALNDYVKVTNADTELRMHYTDKALHDAIPNTVDAPEYYWSKYVK